MRSRNGCPSLLSGGLRPKLASTVDPVCMLEASFRPEDFELRQRVQHMMELEPRLTRQRGLSIER